MTLISCTQNYNNPIMIGDLLISSSKKEDESKLPSYLRDIEKHFQTQKNYPVQLRQKIYVINDNLCVGLSGFVVEMKNFLEDLIQYFKLHETSLENVDRFTADYLDTGVNYVILIMDNQCEKPGFYVYHQGVWEMANVKSCESVLANGSGARDFMKQAQTEWNIENYGELDMLNYALSINYSIIGSILGRERFSLETIKKSWGAGFELIYYQNGAFKKMDDITYIIWHSKLKENAFSNPMPLIVLNYRYFEDLLIISSFNQGGQIELHGALPIYKTPSDIDISKLPNKPHFDSTKICSVFVFQEENNIVYTPTIFTESDGKNIGACKVSFDENGRLQIMIQAEVEDHLMKIANDMLIKSKNSS